MLGVGTLRVANLGGESGTNGDFIAVLVVLLHGRGRLHLGVGAVQRLVVCSVLVGVVEHFGGWETVKAVGDKVWRGCRLDRGGGLRLEANEE